MPRQIKISPVKLEDQCLHVYLNYLHDEMHLIFHLKNFQERSVLLRQHGLAPDRLFQFLQSQISDSLQGILHDMVRQKMLDILISKMHLFISDMHKMFAVGRPPPPLYSRPETGLSPRKLSTVGMDIQGNGDAPGSWLYLGGRGPVVLGGHNGGNGGNNLNNGQAALNNPPTGNVGSGSGSIYNSMNTKNAYSVQQYRSLPIFQLFDLIVHKDLRIIGISLRKLPYICKFNCVNNIIVDLVRI